jgi:L-lysine exporter family protein LysE/ArgO
LRQYVFPIALFCSVSDIILITLGVFGFGAIISEFEYMSKYMFLLGGVWLIGYGFLRLRGAYIADSYLEASSTDKADLKLTLTNCAALTWLNPHVYIDTLVLIGTVSIGYDDTLAFGVGACIASLIFFFTLAFGARLLSPLMKSRRAWQALDVIIAIIMFLIAYSMLSESF